MDLKVISCVLILICIALIMALIWIRIPKQSEREYAGYFKHDAFTKECGWLSNIIWAVYFDGFGWMIYSKSGYVADDRNAVDYKEDVNTTIQDGGYQCPELIRGNHASDIQPFWYNNVVSNINQAARYLILPCIFTFQYELAGVIEGCMHAVTGEWARTHADIFTIARYGAPRVILGDPVTGIWLPPNKIKGVDFKAKNFQWESPHGEMMAFGKIPDAETTIKLMNELRGVIIQEVFNARANKGNTSIMRYPDGSKTKQAYIAALNDRSHAERCGIDKPLIDGETLLNKIKTEADNAAEDAVLIVLSTGLGVNELIQSIVVVGNTTTTLFGEFNAITLSNTVRIVQIINRVINAGIHPGTLIDAIKASGVNVAARQYINNSMMQGIDIEEFIAAITFLSKLANPDAFINGAKLYTLFFDELHDLLEVVFKDPAVLSVLQSYDSAGAFKNASCIAIRDAFLTRFVDSVGPEQLKMINMIIETTITSYVNQVI